MSIKLEKDKIVPVLLQNKVLKANENVYSILINDVKCGIDFKKNEMFWMDGDERSTEELLKHNPYSCKDRAKNRAAEIEEEPEFRPWEKPIPESQARITSWGDGQ